jgi:hypothetical protein
VNLSGAQQVCPVIGNCASCIEFSPNRGTDGKIGACLGVVRSCPGQSDIRYELGCIDQFPLQSCLTCNCHNHGTCDSTNVCTCENGWDGPTCLDPPAILTNCQTLSSLEICGKVYQEDCKLRAALTVSKNQLLSKGIPLLQLATEGKGSACVGVPASPCQACMQIKNAKINADKNHLNADVDLNLSCPPLPPFTKNLGQIDRPGDFSNLETRCFACKGNCTGRGKCKFDGTCICNQPSYGDVCEFTPCPLGDQNLECGGDSKGTCEALTGKCNCKAGFEGNNCVRNLQLYWIAGVVGAGVLIIVVTALLVYKCWWKPRREAELLATTQVVNWVDEAEAEEAKLRAMDADF